MSIIVPDFDILVPVKDVDRFASSSLAFSPPIIQALIIVTNLFCFFFGNDGCDVRSWRLATFSQWRSSA
jgi:hypothetical protein